MVTSAPPATPSVEASSSAAASSRIAQEDGFNSALYSLKAFSIATALVVAGGAASVWGVKTYLSIRDTQEFVSAMRLSLLTKWPLLASRIHRASDSPPLHPPTPLPVTIFSASKPDADPHPPPTSVCTCHTACGTFQPRLGLIRSPLTCLSLVSSIFSQVFVHPHLDDPHAIPEKRRAPGLASNLHGAC
ncbi:hypothetical protein H4582DRAFT_1916776 [Lactarius indigo]|nr:hypothetical protein H4582DRAFT_1916776 [Lactarius indigo]